MTQIKDTRQLEAEEVMLSLNMCCNDPTSKTLQAIYEIKRDAFVRDHGVDFKACLLQSSRARG